MAGRIYVSPITGDGTGENPYRGLICTLQHIVRCRSAIASEPSGENRGRPSRGFTVAYVETRNAATGLEDWSAVDASNQVFLVRLDENVDSVAPQPVKTRIQQSGALTNQELSSLVTFRDILQALLWKHYPDARLKDQWPEIDWGE